jgi:hypothetical protein
MASDVCSICLDEVAPCDAFVSPCPGKHKFHLDCIHKWAKVRLAAAVRVDDGVVRVMKNQLPACPCCREPIAWSHRTNESTRFFLAAASHALMELGTVREHAEQPTLRICTATYGRKSPLAV